MIQISVKMNVRSPHHPLLERKDVPFVEVLPSQHSSCLRNVSEMRLAKLSPSHENSGFCCNCWSRGGRNCARHSPLQPQTQTSCWKLSNAIGIHLETMKKQWYIICSKQAGSCHFVYNQFQWKTRNGRSLKRLRICHDRKPNHYQ